MKKLAIFLAIMLIPMSAFALDTISDSDLDSVTGQAGVSIFTNSIQIVRTDVTTTYTDSNGAGNTTAGLGTVESGSFSIVSDRAVTQVFFKGYDPINIDVVDMADAIAIIETAAGADVITGAGANYDVDEYGESGVQITLPNAIQVFNLNSSKTYYACDTDGIGTDDANEMIEIKTTGGNTTYSLAYIPGGLGATTTAVDMYLDICEGFQWTNVANTSSTGIHNADQIKILITSHD